MYFLQSLSKRIIQLNTDKNVLLSFNKENWNCYWHKCERYCIIFFHWSWSFIALLRRCSLSFSRLFSCSNESRSLTFFDGVAIKHVRKSTYTDSGMDNGQRSKCVEDNIYTLPLVRCVVELFGIQRKWISEFNSRSKDCVCKHIHFPKTNFWSFSAHLYTHVLRIQIHFHTKLWKQTWSKQ